MASFDHWVRPLTVDEREWQTREWTSNAVITGLPQVVRCDYGQGQKRCSRPALYLTTYDYMGKDRRISTCRRRMCLEHAARFATKHGISCNATKSAEDVPAAIELNRIVEGV